MADKGDSGGGITMLRDGTHYVYGVLSTKIPKDDQSVRLFTDVLNAGHLNWLRRHWQRLHISKFIISQWDPVRLYLSRLPRLRSVLGTVILYWHKLMEAIIS